MTNHLSFTVSSKQDSLHVIYSFVWLGIQTTLENVLMMIRKLCDESLQFSGLVYVVNINNLVDYSPHLNYQCDHTTLQHHYHEYNILV